jgi:hypothetical protein
MFGKEIKTGHIIPSGKSMIMVTPLHVKEGKCMKEKKKINDSTMEAGKISCI